METWVKKLNYGNRDISGGIDVFWLTGKLRISAEQQIEFLQRLYKFELPISKLVQKTVEKIMLRDETPGYKIYGKTGWQVDGLDDTKEKHSIGWYVGYLEQNDNVYFFAVNVETNDTKDSFVASRVATTENILRELKPFISPVVLLCSF